MRNHPLKIVKNLAGGLRSDEHNLHGGRLLKCENLESFDYGLRSYEPIEMVFSQQQFAAAGVIQRFPFPQLHLGKAFHLLLDSQQMFQVSDQYELYRLDTYDIATPANSKTIPNGHAWHIADLNNTAWLFNGACVAIITYTQRMVGSTEKVLVCDTVRVNCGCYYKGRLLMGGFHPDYQFSSSWKTLYETLADQRSLTFDYTVGLDRSSVMWSTIGGGDLLYMFDYNRAMTGHLTTAEGLTANLWSASNPYALEATKRNDGGSAKLDIGEVLAIKVLGEHAIVYGSKGIKVLTHSYEPVSGTPAFREAHLSDIGVPYGGAVGGNDKQHCIVGTDGRLRLIRLDQGLPYIREIGYSEFFKSHVNSAIAVSYDSFQNRFLIGTGARTYVLNFVNIGDAAGVPALTWATQQVTSVVAGRGADMVGRGVGVGTHADYISNTGKFKVGAFDMGTRGHKTITGAELHGDIDTDAYIIYHYALKDNKEFTELDPEIFSPDGEIKFNVEGIDINVEVTFDDFRKVVLNSMTLHRYYTDLRHTRGQHADTDVA